MLEIGHNLHARKTVSHHDIVRRQEEATTNQTATVVMDESKLAPLEYPGAACGSKPDLVLDLTFGVNFATGDWMINGIPYRSPKLPTLLNILTDKDGVTESDFTQPEHTVILPKNKCIEFNIKGNSGLGIVHPIHLHGHTFDVIQFANNPPNYVNPPRRDVVGATDAGVRIQFKTDNPGPWFLHCHIDWHLEEGFAMVFAEAPEAIQKGPKSVPVNKQWKGLCEKYSQLPAGFQLVSPRYQFWLRSPLMARTTLLITLSLFAYTILARKVEYNLKVSNGEIAPDGVKRVATLVNDRYPGPLISANKGDTLKIKVQNKLTDPSMYRTTSIHWHGLLQHRNADDDGPAWVTQCPIVPQESYTYTMPLGDQTGTYWYHSHLFSQYVIFLLTAFAVHLSFLFLMIMMADPKDPHKHLYDVDDEKTVLVLGDWYHTPSKEILESGNVTRQRPDSATINGKGRFDPDGTPANPDTLYTLKVKHGKSYRLRLINGSAIASFQFVIQRHKLKVIAVDGVSTKPYEVDAFNILAGQRIDCIVTADQTPDTYWINAPLTNVANKTTQALLVYEDDSHPYRPPQGPYNTWSVSEAIIRYWAHKHGHHSRSGHGVYKARMIETKQGLHGPDIIKHPDTVMLQDNATNETTPIVMDESKLVPLEHPGAACGSTPADLILNLTFGLNRPTGEWMINGIPYHPPKIPTLLKILHDNDTVTESDFTQPEHTVLLPKNKCIEFNIKGNSGLGIVHPIHLHGHTFDVVQFGNNPPNYVNPPRRDVVGATDAGVRIQFKTDNPGPWFLHCHIDWHLEEGFAMVFAEAPEDIKEGPKSVPVDAQWKDLCRKYDELPPGFQ
ncbi:unnamed protein product [Rhizoctonia solani]|uniref:Laccase n=1 Tax=Rhizoctonia solani TaxID=456999 RepID=A0A8H3E9A9_9AGAM|nr:unnamed protein product [Rhizoctonia solani]